MSLKGYHFHIYYSPSTRPFAAELRERFQATRIPALHISNLKDFSHGPHPIPTWEFHVAPEQFMRALQWIIDERGELSVLVHEDTGDDPVDHDTGALWLGTRVELDLTKLDPSPPRPSANT